MTDTDKKSFAITEQVRRIKKKQKLITYGLIGVYVDNNLNPKNILAKGELINSTKEETSRRFTAREMFHKEDGEKILDEYEKYLDGILKYQETVKRKRTQTYVLIIAGLLIVMWILSPSSKENTTSSSTTSTSTSYSDSKNKLDENCKWCNILRYAILKNDNNRAVRCRQNYINNGYYILCTYEAGGYNKRALFKEGLNKAYSINGTARAKEFIRYSDIEPYDIAKNGSVDISGILSKF